VEKCVALAGIVCATSIQSNKKAFYGLWRGVAVNALCRVNEVTLRWARLVLGWVTVRGLVNHLGT